MLLGWADAREVSCVSLSMDLGAVKARHRAAPGVLEAVRTPRQDGWMPLPEREHREFLRTGRRRPPSFLLYPYAWWHRWQGGQWQPTPTRRRPLVLTWAAHRAAQGVVAPSLPMSSSPSPPALGVAAGTQRAALAR